MLFIGVETTVMGCSVSAVSSLFAFLGQGFFYYENKDQFDSWVRPLILSNNEKIAWFFSDKKYHSIDIRRSFFSLSGVPHIHYLVKERVVLDFLRVFNEINSALNNLIADSSLILAMSFKLFDSKYINLYSDSKQLSLWT